MPYVDSANAMYAPPSERPKKLTGTGTAESSNTERLAPNAYATIKVGAVPILVRFSGELGLSGMVDATLDLKLNAWSQFDWVVRPNGDNVVYVEAADGVAVYEAWVWTSSPKV